MSPELINNFINENYENKINSEKSDIFSLGLILLRL